MKDDFIPFLVSYLEVFLSPSLRATAHTEWEAGKVPIRSSEAPQCPALLLYCQGESHENYFQKGEVIENRAKGPDTELGSFI